MENIIIIFIIAIIFLVIAFGTNTTYKKDLLKMETYKQTYATIDRVILSDGGNVDYYVSFFENGGKTIAQTAAYSSETKSLNTGDEVKIAYFFTRWGHARAYILDDRVIPVSNSAPGFCRFMTIVGILLLLIDAVMFVKLIFF